MTSPRTPHSPPLETIFLRPSMWHMQGYGVREWALCVFCAIPLLAAIASGSQVLIGATVVAIGVIFLLMPPAGSTGEVIGAVLTVRAGRLRGQHEEFPVSSIVDVWVDMDTLPLPFPDIGNVTIQCGTKYLHFAGVRHAESVRRRLLARRDQAVAAGPGTP